MLFFTHTQYSRVRNWLLLENLGTKKKVETRWLLLFVLQTILSESIVTIYFLIILFFIRAHVFLLFGSITLKHATVTDWLRSLSTGLRWCKTFFWCSLHVHANGMKVPMKQVFRRILRHFFWSADLLGAFRHERFKCIQGRAAQLSSSPSEGLVSLVPR